MKILEIASYIFFLRGSMEPPYSEVYTGDGGSTPEPDRTARSTPVESSKNL